MVKERSDKRKPVGWNDKEICRTKSDRCREGFIGVFLVFLIDVKIEGFWYVYMYKEPRY